MIYKELIKKCFSEAEKIISKSGKHSGTFIEREIKLPLDQELDSYFRNALESQTKIPVFSEESLGADPMKGLCWVVDPLDGSLNYSRGIPFFTSAIALMENGEPIEGFVYDYSHQDFYCGGKAFASELNGQKIHVSPIDFTQIKATGIPSHSKVEASLHMFEESLIKFKKLRWIGCASVSLCYVACGKVDAYEEKGIKLWDVAAGIAIVNASGGKVIKEINVDGSLNLYASNGN